MEPELSALEKLQIAYDLVADVLGQAPQLYDLHLDQALLVLVLAMKRARRSPRLAPALPAALKPSTSTGWIRFLPVPAKTQLAIQPVLPVLP